MVKTCIANDRGIHICKSMVAGNNLPMAQRRNQLQIKGDHLVGDYYVKFGEELKKQVSS